MILNFLKNFKYQFSCFPGPLALILQLNNCLTELQILMANTDQDGRDGTGFLILHPMFVRMRRGQHQRLRSPRDWAAASLKNNQDQNIFCLCFRFYSYRMVAWICHKRIRLSLSLQ